MQRRDTKVNVFWGCAGGHHTEYAHDQKKKERGDPYKHKHPWVGGDVCVGAFVWASVGRGYNESKTRKGGLSKKLCTALAA